MCEMLTNEIKTRDIKLVESQTQAKKMERERTAQDKTIIIYTTSILNYKLPTLWFTVFARDCLNPIVTIIQLPRRITHFVPSYKKLTNIFM